MYETYVPIRVERKPPTIAEIVRQKTDDGARIIDFFLDVMEGRVEDAQLCHRIDSAKQLVKYGYKKAADFIAEHGDEPCDHCESRKRGPRPRKDQGPAAGPLQSSPPHVQGPYGYDFLTMLTEDFLTVLSAVDEDLMIKLLRAQTRDGGTVIDFLDNVMHGREDGFKVNHRISAARELISHILRDEHATAYAVLDNVGPFLSTVEGADPRVRLLPTSETPSPSILTPSPSTGEGWGEGDSPARGSVGAGLKPALPGAAWEPCNPESVVPAKAEGNPDNTIVVPAKAGTQRGGEGRRSHPILVHPEPVEGPRPDFTGGAADNSSVVPEKAQPAPSTVEEPLPSVHPEPVEEPALSLPKGPRTEFTEGSADYSSVVPAREPAEGRQDYKVRPPRKRRTRRERRQTGNARAAMRGKASTNPGRSPPW